MKCLCSVIHGTCTSCGIYKQFQMLERSDSFDCFKEKIVLRVTHVRNDTRIIENAEPNNTHYVIDCFAPELQFSKLVLWMFLFRYILFVYTISLLVLKFCLLRFNCRVNFFWKCKRGNTIISSKYLLLYFDSDDWCMSI